jgi:molybdenum cofactor biosynthesis protein B
MKSDHVLPVKIISAVLTVSSSRTKATDKSGEGIIKLFSDSGIEVGHYGIVPDRVDLIRNELVKALEHANCVVVNGGTGLTHDDCTIEAVRPFLDKEMEGFGELFRMMSYREIGSSAILSRAIAGISQNKAIFCVPGSPRAVNLAMKELIIPEIPHILSHAGT